ncbi:hypothetical protein LCGC14_2615510 [marine sediment metagenome]|uniref:Uncharacterized protein n=1 Tax=marine sediment metagenome TaxID=412755 RepID=A0A0F9AS76_9ZZZZ
MKNLNKPIIDRHTIPEYKTKGQWIMFIRARKADIEELKVVIKIAEQSKKNY